MITYLLTCLASALCVVAVWRLFNDDASFMTVARYYLSGLPSAIRKPLFECMFCMSSFWGLTWFTVFNYLLGWDFGIMHTLVAVLVIAGFVSLLQGMMHILDWLLSLVKMLEKPEKE